MVDSVQVKIDDVILYRSINVLKLRLDRLVGEKKKENRVSTQNGVVGRGRGLGYLRLEV